MNGLKWITAILRWLGGFACLFLLVVMLLHTALPGQTTGLLENKRSGKSLNLYTGKDWAELEDRYHLLGSTENQRVVLTCNNTATREQIVLTGTSGKDNITPLKPTGSAMADFGKGKWSCASFSQSGKLSLKYRDQTSMSRIMSGIMLGLLLLGIIPIALWLRYRAKRVGIDPSFVLENCDPNAEQRWVRLQVAPMQLILWDLLQEDSTGHQQIQGEDLEVVSCFLGQVKIETKDQLLEFKARPLKQSQPGFLSKLLNWIPVIGVLVLLLSALVNAGFFAIMLGLVMPLYLFLGPGVWIAAILDAKWLTQQANLVAERWDSGEYVRDRDL